MLSRRSRITLAITSIAAIAALFVLAPQGVATKDRSGAVAPIAQTSAQTADPRMIMPAQAEHDTTDWRMATGDQSAN